jgi:hypothetical protein
MRDVTVLLSTLGDTSASEPTDEAVVAADVVRGHRALLRRRRHWVVGSSVVAVAAVAVVTANVASSGGDRVPSVAVQQHSATQQTPQVRLVAYTGAQPAGFTVDTVPAGWRVVSSDINDFVAVPPGTVVKSADVRLTSGIAVLLQGASHLPSGSSATTVTVNGKAAQWGLTRDKAVKWLMFSDAAGHQVLVQVPIALGLTTDQIVRFADGITVTGAARTAGG